MDKKFLFIDFETYWSSRDYTLSKMGPVEYVRDPRFEAQLLGVRINRGPVKVLQGEQIAAFLHGIDWSRRDIVVVWQAVEMAKLGVPLIGNIHDAWLACVPESEADKTEAIMRRCMSMVPPYLEGLPVACDAEVGTDYTIA